MKKKVILCPNPYRDSELKVAKDAKAILEGIGFETVVCLPFHRDGYGDELGVPVRQLQQEIRDSWEKLATAQSETEDFIQRSRDLCAQQLAFLDSLPERNAPEQEDQEPENEAVTLPAPEENAVPVADAEPVPQEEAPQPESAAEPEPQPEFQEKKEEESPFPLDFKLNLEDLQFGRNYNGGDRR